MEYNSKTNWQRDDIVTEKDFNRIEQGIEDACGKLSGIQEGAEVNRPISDAVDLNDSNTSASSMAVKTNADKIGNLETNIGSVSNLNTTSKEVVGAINEVHAQKPDDYGRFVGEFGFDDETITLNKENVKKQSSWGTTYDIFAGRGCGQFISSAKTQDIDIVKYVEFYVHNIVGTAPDLHVNIYDNTTSTVLGTAVLSSSEFIIGKENKVTFSPEIQFTRGNELVIRIDSNGLGSSANYVGIQISSSDTQSDENFVTTTDLWGATSTSFTGELRYAIGYVTESITDTATKTITPSNIEKWGNLKVTASDLNENNSASVDIIGINNYYSNIASNLTTSINIYDNKFVSMKFTTTTNALQIYVNIDNLKKTENLPNNLEVHVYNEIDNLPGASLGFAEINKDIITTDYENYNIKIPVMLNQNSNYFIVFKTDGGDSFNVYSIIGDDYSGIVYYTSDGGSIWTSANLGIGIKISECINAISNQPLTNGENTIDLSSIDITQYPEITTTFNLQRNTTTDLTPVLNNPSWTWKGDDKREVLLYDKIVTIPITEYTFDIDNAIYDKCIIEIENLIGTNSLYERRLRMIFNNLSSGNYSYVSYSNISSSLSNISSYQFIQIGDRNIIPKSSIEDNRKSIVILTIDLNKSMGKYILKFPDGNVTEKGIFSYRYNDVTINNIKLFIDADEIGLGTKFKVIGVKKLV